MFRSDRCLLQCETALVIRFRAQARSLMVTCVHNGLSTSRERFFLRGPIPWSSMRNHDDESDGMAEIRWHNGDDAHKTACCSNLDGGRAMPGQLWVGSRWLPGRHTLRRSVERLAKTWIKVIACLKASFWESGAWSSPSSLSLT
jgi:hypothetical protein